MQPLQLLQAKNEKFWCIWFRNKTSRFHLGKDYCNDLKKPVLALGKKQDVSSGLMCQTLAQLLADCAI